MHGCVWRDRLHVCGQAGIFVLDEARRVLERVYKFRAIAVWPIAEGLLCRGWDAGSAAHRLLRDTTWESFEVPEPGVVSGGQGKSVWMPKRRRVPVVKLRLPAPATKRKPKAFTLRGFVGDLAAKSTPRSPARDTAGAIAALAGTRLAPDLTAYLRIAGSHELDHCAGLWQLDDSFFPDAGAIAATYREFPSILGALTDTLPIGSDGSGDIFVVDLARTSSAVHQLSHDSAQLRPLASSFTTFAALADLEDRWSAHCEATGIDDEDLIDGDHAPPAELRAIARKLDRHVQLAGDFESDYDATINALAGKTLRMTSKSPAFALFERARWLYLLLAFEIAPKDLASIAAARKRWSRDRFADRAATHVYRLFTQFFLGDEPALRAQIALSAKHRSGLVRGTAKLVAEPTAELVARRDIVSRLSAARSGS